MNQLNPRKIVFILWISAAGCCLGQGISFSGIETTYDGAPKHPRTMVGNISRNAIFSYREIRSSEASVIFSNRIPDVLPLSYNSLGFAANSTSALGNLVELNGSPRVADHVEVIMVTWASAANYPALAGLDSSGYRHPIMASIYQLTTNSAGASSVVQLDQATVQVHVPWRPATLPNGSPYPYNGFAFKALIPLAASITVPGNCIVAIGFNTQNSGASPLGVPGPYNELNLALSSALPTVGRDLDTNAVFWIHKGMWFYPASNWGGFGSPILRLSARSTPLPSPVLDSTFQPVNAGVYHARGTIMPEGLTADTVMSISKAPLILQTAGLTKSVADPDPFITVLNTSPGLVTEITYGGSSTIPVKPGRYPFAISATDRNHSGSLSGEFHLTGMTYAQWRQQQFPNGEPAGQATWLTYATGGDLQTNAPPLRLEAKAGGMTASFLRRREMNGGRLALEFSRDLSRWDEVPTQAEAAGDFWDSLSTTSKDSDGFFRLKARID